MRLPRYTASILCLPIRNRIRLPCWSHKERSLEPSFPTSRVPGWKIFGNNIGGAQALGSLKIDISELHSVSTVHLLHELGVAEIFITRTPPEFKVKQLDSATDYPQMVVWY